MSDEARLGHNVSPEWRGVYRDLRSEGAPRFRSLLLATGLWCLWPFRWMFPLADDAPLPPPREPK